MTQELRDLARGRWTGLLPSFGVSPIYLTGRQTGCPICKEGIDRFRFDNKKNEGTWICNTCGAGDGFSLITKTTGKPFREVARQIKQMVGRIEPDKLRKPPNQEALKRALNGVWSGALPLSPDDPPTRFLCLRRKLRAPFPRVLRFHEGLRADADGPLWPCLVARITAPDGSPATVHRTFLAKDGSDKAPIDTPRKLMRGRFPKGSAVRLAPLGETLGVAEGIETALAAQQITGIPCWSVVNAGNMAEWIWPSEVKRLVVFGDNDKSYTGQMAAFALAKRALQKGLSVEVRIPPELGQDWNDILMEG